jgi:hypothetical protein
MSAREWYCVVRRALEGGALGEWVEQLREGTDFRGRPYQLMVGKLLATRDGKDWAELAEDIAGPLPARAVLVEGWARAHKIGRIVGRLIGRTFVVEL